MKIFSGVFGALGFAVLLSAGAASAQRMDVASRSADEIYQSCVEVIIGPERSDNLNCVNSFFERKVQEAQTRPQPEAPVTAQSSPTQVGTFTDVAAHQMMGNAYGVSATPQRPTRVFVNPLAR